MSTLHDDDWTLTDARIDELIAKSVENPCPRTAVCRDDGERFRFAMHVVADKLLAEVKHHRAATKRLEELALSLEHSHHPDMRAVGDDLRGRLVKP